MFGRKCPKCNERISKKFEFCPYCGNPIKNSSDYGLLGKSDNIKENFSLPLGLNSGLGNSFFDKMLGSALKMVEKEIQKISTEEQKLNTPKIKNSGINPNFELYINGKRINLPGNIAGIQVEKIPNYSEKEDKKQKDKLPKISEELIEESKKLPRKEAKTKLTRTSEKITYELETPGLNSLNNVLINKLEDSLEIKVYTKKAVFFKTLSIKLPLIKYGLKDERLFLEFKASN